MEIVISPNSINYNLFTFWKYRELIFFLAWRDIKIRYKQTFIGIFWIILQPFLTKPQIIN